MKWIAVPSITGLWVSEKGDLRGDLKYRVAKSPRGPIVYLDSRNTLLKRVVAEAFFGIDPDELRCHKVIVIDEDEQNVAFSNLKLVSLSDTAKKSIERAPRRKKILDNLPDKTMRDIHHMEAEGFSRNDIANVTGISTCSLRKLLGPKNLK